MEPIRFADILFTILTLLIIYIILALVKKSQQKKRKYPLDNVIDATTESGSKAKKDA